MFITRPQCQADTHGGTIRALYSEALSCVAGGLQQNSPGGAQWSAWRRDPLHTARSAGAVSALTAWRFETQGPVLSSPAISGSALIIGSEDSWVYAIDLASGTLVGSFRTCGAVVSSPVVGADGTLYVGCRNTVYAHNFVTGRQWTFSGLDDFDSSLAIAADGAVFFGAHFTFYSLNGSTGLLRWSFLATNMISSAPALSLDCSVIYFGCDSGIVYALNASDGTLQWSTFLSPEGLESSPAIVGDTLFIGSNDGAVYALDSASGAARWRYATQGAIVSSPAVGDAVVVVGSLDSCVYAIHAVTGKLRWVAQTGGPVWSSPAIDDAGIVYVGSDDGRIYSLDPCSGELLWNFTTGGRVRSSPALSGGTVFVGSHDGFVYAVARVPAGFALNASGAIASCPTGHYCVGGFEVFATPCPAGTYRSLEGATSPTDCLVCPTATYTASAGLAACSGGPQNGSPWPLRGHDTAHTSRAVFSATASGWAFTFTGVDVGAPVLGPGGAVYVRCSGAVFALRSSSPAALIWQREIPFSDDVDTRGYSSMVIAANGDVYVGNTLSFSGSVQAFHGASGDDRWWINVGYPIYNSPAVGADGTVFVACASFVNAVQPDPGRYRWTYATNANGEFFGSPVLGSSAVYVASTDSRVHALDLSTGALLWEFATAGQVYGTPALLTTEAGEVVLVGSLDSHVYSLNGQTGSLLWKRWTGGPVHAPISIGPDGIVYIGSAGGVLAVLGVSGVEWWSFAVDGIVFGFALGPGREVYFSGAESFAPGAEGFIGELDGATGELRWMRSLRGLISAPVLASDGSLFFSARDSTHGYMLALVPAQPGNWLNLAIRPFVGQSVGLTSLCAVGHYCVGGFAAAAPCPPGQYGPQQGAASCVLCPAGTFNGITGATAAAQCTPCPLGYASAVLGASNISACTICKHGMYGTLGAATCSLCPRGTYLHSWGGFRESDCIYAPPGHYVSEPGWASPELCDPGTFSVYPGGWGGGSGGALGTRSHPQTLPPAL